MKKIKFLQLCFGFLLLFTSCSWMQNQEINEENSSSKKIELITSNAELLISQNEILSSLKISSRSETVDSSNILNDSDLSNDDLVELTNFSNSPSDYVNENIDFNETCFNDNLELIYSIYNKSTVDEVISNMESVSLEMAEEYKQSISDFYNTLDYSSRSVIDANGGIGSQKLYIFPNELDSTSTRAISFGTDLSWSSVARYTGYSAASIAGACCYKWGVLPWIRYPGLAVCISGIGCMGALMGRWSCSSQLAIITTSVKSIANSVSKIKNLTNLTDAEKRNKFLSTLKESLQNYIMENPDYESEIKKIIEYIDSNYIDGKSFYNSVKDILNFCMSDGQIGMQLATVGVSTASVVTSCWFTGIVGVLQNAYFAIIDFISKWLVITTNSISIAL